MKKIYRKVNFNYGSSRKVLEAIDYVVDGVYKATAIIEPENPLKYGECGSVRLRVMGENAEILIPGATKETIDKIVLKYL